MMWYLLSLIKLRPFEGREEIHAHTHIHTRARATAQTTMDEEILLHNIASGVWSYPFSKLPSLYPMGSEKLGWSEIAIIWCIRREWRHAVLFLKMMIRMWFQINARSGEVPVKSEKTCHMTRRNWDSRFFLGIILRRVCYCGCSSQQRFSTAGPRSGTGPWHQLYRAAKGYPGICHFSFLSNFHE